MRPPGLPVLTAGDIVVDPGHGHLSVADGIVVLVVHHAFDTMMHLGERTAEEDKGEKPQDDVCYFHVN